MIRFRICWSVVGELLVFFVSLGCSVRAAESGAESNKRPPKVAAASDEGERAIKRFQVPKDFKVELVAAEPHLANPVAFWIDEKGNIYVAETFRHTDDVLDIREHLDWLDEDLASQSVEESDALLK